MLSYTDVLSLQYLNKQIFSGSVKGLCYRIESIGTDDKKKLILHIWKGPLAFHTTNKKDIRELEFPYTEDGRKQAIDAINAEYKANESLYEDTSLI